MPTRSPLAGTLVVLAGASLFALLGITSRTAYDLGMTPAAFVAWRALVAAAVMWLVGRARGGRPGWLAVVRSADARERRGLLVAIVVGAALNLFLFAAFERTTIALALLAFYTYPALTAAASAVLGREPMDRTRATALLLALGGMVAVVAGGLGSASGLKVDPLGIALGLGAALCQVVFLLVSRDYQRIPADQAMGWILAGAGAIAAMLTVVGGGGVATLALPFSDIGLLGLLAFVGVFAAAIPSFIFLLGIRWIGPVRTGIVMLWEPVMGVVIAAAFLAEPLVALQVAGGATILAAALMVQRAPIAPGDVLPVEAAPGGP